MNANQIEMVSFSCEVFRSECLIAATIGTLHLTLNRATRFGSASNEARAKRFVSGEQVFCTTESSGDTENNYRGMNDG